MGGSEYRTGRGAGGVLAFAAAPLAVLIFAALAAGGARGQGTLDRVTLSSELVGFAIPLGACLVAIGVVVWNALGRADRRPSAERVAYLALWIALVSFFWVLIAAGWHWAE